MLHLKTLITLRIRLLAPHDESAPIIVLYSIKASRGGVCMVKIMSAPTKPMVDAHASDASLWVRVGVRVRA